MNTFKIFKSSATAFASILFLLPLFTSCNDSIDVPETPMEQNHKQVCKLVLNASKPSYESRLETRGTSDSEWQDGSTIYIKFVNNGKSVLGMATYSSAIGLWEVAFESALEVVMNGDCALYYFENADDINTNGASIGGTTGIYEDLKGVYAFDGDQISISANLTPKLGRVRFSGNKNDTVMLAGVKRYGYFNANDCTYKLDSTEVMLSATVEEGGKFYTPYYYGAMIDGNSTLQITDMKDAFARYCSDVFKAGNSGYMKIPHADNFSGWMKNDPLAQSKVAINWPDSISDDRRAVIMNIIETMIPVEGGSFWMGAQSYDSKERNYSSHANTNESPVHMTVVSPFYLGRTEVTQKQWKAVMGYNAPVVDGNNYPVRYLRKNWSNDIKDEYLAFVNKLNFITGLEFSLPTEAEWEYAAFGGKNGAYKFWAGTKTYNEKYFVSIYGSPYCSTVGTKLPNELGLYDMTGNVSEICYGIGDYTDKLSVNPRWDNDTYSYRGGSASDIYYDYDYNNYYKTTPFFMLTNRTSYETQWGRSVVGLRLCLRLIEH